MEDSASNCFNSNGEHPASYRGCPKFPARHGLKPSTTFAHKKTETSTQQKLSPSKSNTTQSRNWPSPPQKTLIFQTNKFLNKSVSQNSRIKPEANVDTVQKSEIEPSTTKSSTSFGSEQDTLKIERGTAEEAFQVVLSYTPEIFNLFAEDE